MCNTLLPGPGRFTGRQPLLWWTEREPRRFSLQGRSAPLKGLIADTKVWTIWERKRPWLSSSLREARGEVMAEKK